MEKSKLLLGTYDAKLTKLRVNPKCKRTEVSYKLKMYDEKLQKLIKRKMMFEDVAAIEFRMNYFDNPMGAEVFGFYEIFAREEKEALLERNFVFRKEGFLYHENYEYEEEDSHDMLNYKSEYEKVRKNLDKYHLFQQQTTGGIYLILAKKWSVKS